MTNFKQLTEGEIQYCKDWATNSSGINESAFYFMYLIVLKRKNNYTKT